MQPDEIAVIADVHGNAWALEAALADIARRGVKQIVNLGDNANGPLDPVRSVALLRASGAVHVRGNGDRMTAEGGSSATASARFARERLDPDALQWLRELPLQAEGPGWMAFHAVPDSDDAYLVETVVAGKAVMAAPNEIAKRLGPTQGTLVLCGHTHIPRLVRLEDGRTVVNPGSVGLPAYTSDSPEPHVVETGSPDVRYAIVRRSGQEWQVNFHRIAYDWRSAARAARAAGWSSWAGFLESGFARL